jgi:hypothetical protein
MNNDISVSLAAIIALLWIVGSLCIILDMTISSEGVEKKICKYNTPVTHISKEEIEDEIEESFVIVEEEIDEKDIPNSSIFENMQLIEDSNIPEEKYIFTEDNFLLDDEL